MEGKRGDLIVGIMVGVFGLIGLILASGALDIEMYVFGLSLAGFATLFIFGLVKRHHDEKDVGYRAGGQGGH